MLYRSFFLLFVLSVMPAMASADWQRLDTDDLDVEIIGERHHRTLRQYPVEERRHLFRAYLQAREGREYKIKVRNRTNRRIGVVIAVDGRNIISGKKSNLRRDERMYILGPRESRAYSGWRTSRNRVNRFYFTDAPDSYAGRWGDYSAMGVIAVAAFAEKRRYYDDDYYDYRKGKPGKGTKPKGKGKIVPRHRSPSSEPGTGFGQSEWSPSRKVNFRPERKPFARYFLKYEWRHTLCDLGVTRCGNRDHRGHSAQHHDHNEYARVPPGLGRWHWDW